MTSQDLYTKISKTLTSFLHSHTLAARTQQPSHLSSHLSPTCTRTFAPHTYLISKGVDSATHGFTNAEYEAHAAIEYAKYSDIEMTVLDTVIDERKRKGWAWVQQITKLKRGGEMTMECVWMVEVDENGEKVVRCRQFLDTGACEGFLAMGKGKG